MLINVIGVNLFHVLGKPYGKQSESLQKTLMDTIQIVQTLRNYLPPPHIPVSSWKSENSATTPSVVNNVTQGISPIGLTGVQQPLPSPSTSLQQKSTEINNI